MPRLLVIDDRDQTIEMCHRHLPQFDYVTRCGRAHPCQVCEERDKGCALKCAHDYQEAAQTLSREGSLPDLVVLDLHFALPAERLLPEDKGDLKLEQVRRKQGLFILERLRRDYPTLPVVMLTTTEGDPATLPQDPLVHFCENEVVDSRTLAAEISRALTLHHEGQEGPVFWGRSPAMAELRRQLAVLARSPLPVLIEGETGTGKSFLAEHVLHPRSGAKGPLVVTDLSTVPDTLMPAHLSDRGAAATPDRPTITRACSNRLTAARSSSTRSQISIWNCKGSCCSSSNAGPSRASAIRARGRRRPSWWRRRISISRISCGKAGSGRTSTCGSIRPRG